MSYAAFAENRVAVTVAPMSSHRLETHKTGLGLVTHLDTPTRTKMFRAGIGLLSFL